MKRLALNRFLLEISKSPIHGKRQCDLKIWILPKKEKKKKKKEINILVEL